MICKAAQWLSKWPNWTVTAIYENLKTDRSCCYSSSFDDLQKLSDYIDNLNGVESMFFNPAIDLRDPLEIIFKMTKAHIAGVTALWADIDCYHHGLTKEEAMYQLARCESLPGPASIMTCSGEGVHGFWLLEEVFNIKGADGKPDYSLMTDFENRLRGIVAATGGLADSACTDASRMLRLPYTINIPGKKKRLAGRQPLPAYELQPDNGRRYKLEDFPISEGKRACDPAIKLSLERELVELLKAAGPETIESLDATKISPFYKHLIRSDDHNNATAAKIITYLLRVLFSISQVYGIVSDIRFGIGRYFAAKADDTETRRQIARCYIYLQNDDAEAERLIREAPYDRTRSGD